MKPSKSNPIVDLKQIEAKGQRVPELVAALRRKPAGAWKSRFSASGGKGTIAPPRRRR